ncbi:MAG: proteasome accessory factor PafA2 family protein [Nitrospirae bacterium]|nr:proteasome accessory factor PafA2 family protein [Nitrospirota bacterium]
MALGSGADDRPWVRVVGLETEYGITRDASEAVDPVTESMALVRAHMDRPFREAWNYRDEDPHRDARGFRVDRLEQDEEEDEFAAEDAKRPFSFRQMKSDLILGNGARFYNDHTHPEYSTPECVRLVDLAAHDRAGEAIVWNAAWRRNRALEAAGQKGDVSLYKNNTDFHGHSYGCHDNYLLPRAVPFGELADRLMPFLVSRQVIAGAGKIGVESAEGYSSGRYQISQRADFIETELSVNTMRHRPLVNTRDEPHADPSRFRRLHLILGDANMSDYATALKVGTTRLVLDLIERGLAPTVSLDHPVDALKAISLDPELKAVVSRRDGKGITAVELQGLYLDAAQRHLAGSNAETDWVLREWTDVLSLVVRDRAALHDRLDWVTKWWLLETFVEDQRLQWDHPWLASLDLEYHHLDPGRGLYRGLEAEGKVHRLADEAAVASARERGPVDTRAAVRGLCVRKFPDEIDSIQWGNVVAKGNVALDLEGLFHPDEIRRLYDYLEEATGLAAGIRSWQVLMKSRGDR